MSKHQVVPLWDNDNKERPEESFLAAPSAAAAAAAAPSASEGPPLGLNASKDNQTSEGTFYIFDSDF